MFEEIALHPLKVGIFYATLQQRMIGQIFFEKSVDVALYRKIITNFSKLTEGIIGFN